MTEYAPNQLSAIRAKDAIAQEIGRYILNKSQSSFIWILECLEAIEIYTGKEEKSARELFDACAAEGKQSIAIDSKINGVTICDQDESQQIAPLNTGY